MVLWLSHDFLNFFWITQTWSQVSKGGNSSKLLQFLPYAMEGLCSAHAQAEIMSASWPLPTPSHPAHEDQTANHHPVPAWGCSAASLCPATGRRQAGGWWMQQSLKQTSPMPPPPRLLGSGDLHPVVLVASLGHLTHPSRDWFWP